MSLIALWIGVVIFGLGAIFSLLSAIRTLQISRRWSDYRLRRRYEVQARGAVLISVLSGALAVALLIYGGFRRGSVVPAAPPPTATQIPTETASPMPAPPPTDTALPAAPPTDTLQPPPPPSDTPFPVSSLTDTASPVPATATPMPSTPSAMPSKTSTVTATPVMPIAVQAMVEGTAAPSFDVEFGRLRFSTQVNNYTLVAPGERFHNPIKQIYAVFAYQPVGVKVEWTALWYQNGELKYVDTTSWQDFPPGVAVAGWARPAPEWTPGDYEVQIFVGTGWETSGRFVLEGEPSTITPSPRPSATASITPTATAPNTPTNTLTATASPVPPPTRTPRPSATPRATLTASPIPIATRTSAPTARPTATLTAIPTATRPPTLTFTATASRTPVPSSTPTQTPSLTPTWTPTPTITSTPLPVQIEVFFLKTSPQGALASPVEEAVTREVPGSVDPITAALNQYFAGPSADEEARGLVPMKNGFVGHRRTDFVDGSLSVYLGGNCTPTGTGYSLARPLIATLKQFPGVLKVRIYDAYDHTGAETAQGDSWPVCLDVIFTNTPTPAPTRTPTATPSNTPTPRPTSTATAVPTNTSAPTSTFTPEPSRTPLPTSTPSPRPTRPLPTATEPPAATATAAPSRTPLPTFTFTPRPSATATAVPSDTALPTDTYTPRPTWTPTITLTPRPTWTSTITLTPRPTFTPTVTRTPRPTLTPTNTLTPTPSNTPRPTLTLTPINAPTQTGSGAPQVSPTAAASAGPPPTLDAACNHAEFLGDVTIADNATLRPGERFRKTWRVQNAGNCPWNAAYSLIFIQGDQMGSPDSVSLPTLIAAGQSADISVDLIAPTTLGEYQGYWQLKTPEGTPLGIGPTGGGSLWVKIQVAGAPIPTAQVASATGSVATQPAQSGGASSTPTTASGAAIPSLPGVPVTMLELAGNACSAQWQANDGILDCPGQEGDPHGTISVLRGASLEDGTSESLPTLLTVPSAAADGYILGLYPQYQVGPGDHFRALVGCAQDAKDCSVLFRLSYLDETGAAHDLWSLGEFYDGKYFSLDVDLGDLAGQQIRLVLSANNLGNSTGDQALWVAPRIVRYAEAPVAPAPTQTAAPTPVAATATLPPTPTFVPASPTPAASTPAPEPPIPQFFESVLDFLKRLFSAP